MIYSRNCPRLLRKRVRLSSKFESLASNREAPILISIIVSFFLLLCATKCSLAQSIGYHPTLNLGFNPYLSPVYGYGLGLPYGAIGFSPIRNLWLANSFAGLSSNGLLSKVHAKSLLKKITSSQLNPHGTTFNNKLTLLKHPEYSLTPYGLDYGHGKHYGSAMVPNNPYKSAYGDYYTNQPIASNSHGLTPHNNLVDATGGDVVKPLGIMKPLIKAGALLTAAALLGKKTISSPIKLNPSGMIINGGYD